MNFALQFFWCLSILFAITLSAESAEWRLLWSDEFDSPGKPDMRKWQYGNIGFLRNKEEQWYSQADENVYVKDGCLYLVAKLEKDKLNPWYQEASDNWKYNRKNIEITSGALISKGTFEFKYGRAEIRAKLPAGQGVWPAFWTIGTDTSRGNWPAIGEIDVMEFMGRAEGKSKLQGAIHWKNKDGKHQQKNKVIQGRNFTEGFHVFAIEWDTNKISFFYDDDNFMDFDVNQADNDDFNPFRAPHFLLLNLAIGGTLGGEVDRTVFPAQYIIDYVRVYQKPEEKLKN